MRLIDADALINEYCGDCEAYIHRECDRDVCATAQWITEAPTIDARPVVRGEWEDFADKHDKRSSRHDFRCSKCCKRASYFVHGSEDWWDGGEPNFCPNCGAEMRKGEEDGD